MHTKPNRAISKRFMVVVFSLEGLILLAVATVCIWSRQQDWVLETPPSTKVYTSHLPNTAEIIEGWADVPDIFGDFSMQVVFTLSDEELDKLLEVGWAWFPFNLDYSSSTPDWQSGTLSSGSFSRLENKPGDEIIYTYLEWSETTRYQFVAIDREKRIVYYSRESW